MPLSSASVRLRPPPCGVAARSSPRAAQVLLALGRLDEALEHVQRAVAIREKYLPVDPQTGQRPSNKDLESAYKLARTIEARQLKREATKAAAEGGDGPL